MLRGSVNNTTNPAAPTDANFNQVSLLLHGDGTNGAQNNTFLDSSTNNFTITRNGNTTQGTNTPFSQAAGYWSNYFDGTGDYLSIASNTAINLSSGDFTIEGWVYWNGANNIATILDKDGVYGSSYSSYGVSLNGSQFISFYVGSGNGTSYNQGISSNTALIKNTWTYFAAVKNGTTLTLYQNGINVASATQTGTIIDGGKALLIGYAAGQPSNIYWDGYLSNVRIVKGTAVYTSNFTPPTTPLTAITNTSLLTCQSNYLKDNSSNNFTITKNGDVSVQPFSPFAPTSAYSTSVNGGSMYFDGTGDSLTTPASTQLILGGISFTVEAWVYVTTSSEPYQHIYKDSPGKNLMFLDFSGGSNGVLSSQTSTSATKSGVTINQWHHLAVVRNGTSVTCYVDGVGGTAQTIDPGSSTAVINYIGTDGGGPARYFNGYMSNLRILAGTALYTTNFTPPTAPLTAITNTQLLLSGTNAGIYDNAIKNNLETVGNAQVSTSVKKYGTGSMYFDGTGDWLTSPDTPNLQLGTGNFTIEGWVYLNAVGSARGFISKGTSTTGWSLGATALNQIIFNYASSSITSTGVLVVSTWYFVTVVREGTGTNQTKIYINGTNDGTGTVATNFNQTSIMYVGADRVGGSALNGYIDDLRITKGIARYTANFTAPTSAFPNS